MDYGQALYQQEVERLIQTRCSDLQRAGVKVDGQTVEQIIEQINAKFVIVPADGGAGATMSIREIIAELNKNSNHG